MSATTKPGPNFFIVGGPKCGTTSLYHYLSSHPDVFLTRKELHHFGSDLVWPRVSAEEYFATFAGSEGFTRRGDASAGYLYSQRAAREIHDYCPSAWIIVMLRNPVDVMYSFHGQTLWDDEEDITDFEEALDAEEARKRGERIPPRCTHDWSLFYRDLARFSQQLERYLTAFGRDRVHIIVFDDLESQPAEEYRRTLEFLGLGTEHEPEFKVYNRNKQLRSRRLDYFIKHRAMAMRRLVRLAFPDPHRRRRVFERVLEFNVTSSKRTPLSSELRQRLQREFAVEVERLSNVVGRDLTYWTLPDPHLTHSSSR